MRAVKATAMPNFMGIIQLIKKGGCSWPSPKWGLGGSFKTRFPPVASLCSGGRKDFASPLLLNLARNRKVR